METRVIVSNPARRPSKIRIRPSLGFTVRRSLGTVTREVQSRYEEKSDCVFLREKEDRH